MANTHVRFGGAGAGRLTAGDGSAGPRLDPTPTLLDADTIHISTPNPRAFRPEPSIAPAPWGVQNGATFCVSLEPHDAVRTPS